MLHVRRIASTTLRGVQCTRSGSDINIKVSNLRERNCGVCGDRVVIYAENNIRVFAHRGHVYVHQNYLVRDCIKQAKEDKLLQEKEKQETKTFK